MAQLQVQPGQYVAIEIAQKSRTRYEKAQVVQVTESEIVLSRRQRYDLDGFPLDKNGRRKQVTPGTGTLIPLTTAIEQRIEQQELVDELANMDWTLWMMVPTEVLRKIKALLQQHGPMP